MIDGFDDREQQRVFVAVANNLLKGLQDVFGLMQPDKHIGYWAERQGALSGLPWPGDLIDLNWDRTERTAVVEYLKAGNKGPMEFGYAPCRLCDKPDNGGCDMSDGVWTWPEGYVHYVQEHGVKPPDEFIQHALFGTRSID